MIGVLSLVIFRAHLSDFIFRGSTFGPYLSRIIFLTYGCPVIEKDNLSNGRQ